MGTTFTDLKVDWKAKPRVKVIGVKTVDRIPADFYDFKLDDPNLVTALMVFVETEPKVWKAYYINNWVHKWGTRLTRSCTDTMPTNRLLTTSTASLVQVAPFEHKSQAIIEKNKDNPSLMFHGRIRSTRVMLSDTNSSSSI